MATLKDTLDLALDSVECRSLYALVDEVTLMAIHGLHVDLPVTCDFCSQTFYDLNVFDTHMQTHLECRYFSCQLCNNTYQSWGNLIAHRKATHHGKVLSCKDCGKRKLHLNLGPVNFPLGDLVHGCEECNEGFNSMPHLVRHYSKMHSEHNTPSHTQEKLDEENVQHVPKGSIIISLRCPLCKTKFYNLEQLSAHIRKQNPLLVCNICKINFCNNLHLEEHMTSHNDSSLKEFYEETRTKVEDNSHSVYSKSTFFGDKRDSLKKQIALSCSVCMQSFSVPTALKRHMKLHMPHSKKEILTCKICNIVIKNQKGLINHLKSKHLENLTTDYQNIIKRLKNNYMIHKKVKFTCEYCGRDFNKKENLLLHVRRHLGERPYTCQYCEKSFFTNQQLLIHNYQHTGERPYTCKTQMCNKTFTSPTALYMHCKIHSNSKPHTCPHCKKQFLYRASFIGHVRLHTGHRPFQCPICDKTFTVKGKLNLHLKTHVQRHLFQHKCSDCGNCFDTAEELSSHSNEECCVTLVTVTKDEKSLINGTQNQAENQYIIRFLDHTLLQDSNQNI